MPRTERAAKTNGLFHRLVLPGNLRSVRAIIPKHLRVPRPTQERGREIKPGDVFVCYLTRLSRWFGLLDVIEGPFTDNTPIFVKEDDPFTVRFRVRPKVWLQIENGIPIHEDSIWAGLSCTRGLDRDSLAWTGKVVGRRVRL